METFLTILTIVYAIPIFILLMSGNVIVGDVVGVFVGLGFVSLVGGAILAYLTIFIFKGLFFVALIAGGIALVVSLVKKAKKPADSNQTVQQDKQQEE